jgi:hypothetical protein
LLRDRLPPRVVAPYAAAIPKTISETPRAAVSSKSPFVKTTTAVTWSSRAVMRGGAMAQEQDASMTWSRFSRALRVLP